MSSSKTLESLSPREAIADAVYRATFSIDTNDVDLFKSAFSSQQDSVVVMTGNTYNGIEQICTEVFNTVGPMDTTHLVTNVRIDYKNGSEKASLTAVANAQHCRPGEGMTPDGAMFTGAGIYLIDVVKEGTEWKIARWEIQFKWFHGDRSVMGWNKAQ